MDTYLALDPADQWPARFHLSPEVHSHAFRFNNDLTTDKQLERFTAWLMTFRDHSTRFAVAQHALTHERRLGRRRCELDNLAHFKQDDGLVVNPKGMHWSTREVLNSKDLRNLISQVGGDSVRESIRIDSERPGYGDPHQSFKYST